MKKIILLLLMLLLCACNNTDKSNDDSLTIVTPKGAPVLAFYDQIKNNNYIRVDASAINALWLGDNSPDIIVCDILSGYKAIKNSANYSMASVITAGNYYLASTGNDDNKTLDIGDTVVLFGNENQAPNMLFHLLYGNDYDNDLIYESDVLTASSDLINGKTLAGQVVDYVFMAQPALYSATQKNKNVSIYEDIGEKYYKKTNSRIIQATVFVNNDTDRTKIEDFLKRLKTSISNGIQNVNLISNALSIYEDEEAIVEYGFNPNVILKAFKMKNYEGLNSLGLCYYDAFEIKDDIDYFLDIFGMENTINEDYFE